MKCERNLAEVAVGCPTMFDGAPGSFPACPSSSVNQSAWNCDDLVTFSLSTGDTTGDTAGDTTIDCYYDSTSQALVGAEAFSDAPTPCGPGSASVTAGQTPSHRASIAGPPPSACAPASASRGSQILTRHGSA